MTTSISQIHFTVDDEDAAGRIVDALLQDRLIACAHRFQPVTSSYWWQGSIETSTEWLATVKTRTSLVDQVIDRVRALHPYDTPEILMTPITGGNPAYIEWVQRETMGSG
jgi:periplasmic divalent cation tolerance protein